MREVKVWMTGDGEKFPTFTEAHDHAAKRYGDMLRVLADTLARAAGGRSADASAFIEANLPGFATLDALRRDMEDEDAESDEYDWES